VGMPLSHVNTDDIAITWPPRGCSLGVTPDVVVAMRDSVSKVARSGVDAVFCGAGAVYVKTRPISSDVFQIPVLARSVYHR
jgi:hypothetical protein